MRPMPDRCAMPSRPDPLRALWGRLRHLVVGVPFAWLLFFFALPFVILLRISITDMGEQLDPFASLLRTVNGQLGFFVQIQSFISLVRSPDSGWFDTLYLESYALSLKYAVFTTALCLFIGYPFAYFLARARPAYRALLLLMVMLLLQQIVMASPLLKLKQKNSRAQKAKLNAGSSITMRSKNLCYRMSPDQGKSCKSH
jgi:ABC-type glycerol-3-phosphate transport system permease component